MAVLGEAFINVRADLKPFSKDLAKELKVVLNAAEKEVAKRGEAIGKKLSDSIASGARDNAHKIGDTLTKETEKHKVKIKTEIDEDGLKASAKRGLKDLDQLAKGAGTSFIKRVGDGIASGARFVSGSIQSALEGGLKTPVIGPAIAIAITALIAQLLALLPAAIQATQALGGFAATLALLPGVGAAAALSMGILSTAFDGFDKAISDALSGDIDKFNKDLEHMSPSAKAAAKALQPMLTMFHTVIQEGLFQQLVGPFRALAKALSSPQIKSGIDLLARSFGALIAEVVKFAASKEGISVLDAVITSIFQSLMALTPAIKPLAQAFGTLIKAGAGVLPRIATVIATLAEHFAAFIDKAEKSGALDKFFDNLGKIFESLGPVVEQVVGRLIEFLDWAASNPDAITGLADAFSMLADALIKAFSDPQVVGALVTTLEILKSIPPSAWEAMAIGILRAATALGAFGAVLIWLEAQVSDKVKKISEWFDKLLNAIDVTAHGIGRKGGPFRSAGAALMSAFFEGITGSIKGLGSIAEAVVSRVKASFNSAIGAINSRLTVAFKVLGVSAPGIPYLAKGAVIDQPTLAMVGEAGPEAVVPLSDPVAAASVLMKSGLANMMAPLVQVFLGAEELDQRVYRIVSRNNTAQARALSATPRLT